MGLNRGLVYASCLPVSRAATEETITMMTTASPIAVCLKLTRDISQTRTVEEIYTTALDALADGLGVSRSSILLFDTQGVMRFAAWRGISDRYRIAVEGHTPWRPNTPNPEPLVVADVTLEPALAALLPTIQSEGIAALAFIPLVSLGRVIGKFMLYYDEPRGLASDDLQLASVIAAQVAFAVERTRAEAQARSSEAAAEAASRLKDDFLATLSHELRTPLNAILGWVQMLQAGVVGPERLRQAIDVISRNTTLQARLIEDILDVSRIVSGKLEIDSVPIPVAPLIDTVVTGMLPTAQAKNVELVKTTAGDLPVIDGDPKRLHQVLGNVLSNAVKFTPSGGRIDVRCTCQGDAVEIEVQDSGAGIASEFLPYVFERFQQADSRSIRRHGGLGLGLAIARHLVEQHHGEIRATSDGPGLGTTVHIRLPVSTESGSRPAPALPTPIESDGEFVMHGMTVLIVDDHSDSCELLAALFERHGARVVQCDSAESALGVLTDIEANLLVADIAMPDIDGYELIRRVRTSHPALPAVAVSAYARPQDRRRAIAAGYDGYCAKPVEAPQLLRAVRDVMLAS
jgi:signal transduction histidine kinase/CheY-like chemotaxis protein